MKKKDIGMFLSIPIEIIRAEYEIKKYNLDKVITDIIADYRRSLEEEEAKN